MLIESNAAIDLILKSKLHLPQESVALNLAAGRYLAEDILAPIDHPLFDQSAVDGYAIRFSDLAQSDSLTLNSEVKAGDAGNQMVESGFCARIFTGAPLPPGADTVVMQEFTTVNGSQIQFQDKKLKPGGNVRRQAEQIATGSLALKKGDSLNPAAIGFLASLGIQKVAVISKPKVGIIVTGNEFAENADDLKKGKIYESNGQMLQAAFAKLGITVQYETCLDDLESLKALVAKRSQENDIIILTGGVSVGDYDFSRPALEANAFEIVFHKVNQKPGKPLLFAQQNTKLAFGLPGNPRAVMVSFYIYILPLLNQLMGGQAQGLRKMLVPITHDFKRNADGKTHFVTGKITENGLNLLAKQQSHMLQSLAVADVIVVLPPSPQEYASGDLLEVRWLD